MYFFFNFFLLLTGGSANKGYSVFVAQVQIIFLAIVSYKKLKNYELRSTISIKKYKKHQIGFSSIIFVVLKDARKSIWQNLKINVNKG